MYETYKYLFFFGNRGLTQAWLESTFRGSGLPEVEIHQLYSCLFSVLFRPRPARGLLGTTYPALINGHKTFTNRSFGEVWESSSDSFSLAVHLRQSDARARAGTTCLLPQVATPSSLLPCHLSPSPHFCSAVSWSVLSTQISTSELNVFFLSLQAVLDSLENITHTNKPSDKRYVLALSTNSKKIQVQFLDHFLKGGLFDEIMVQGLVDEIHVSTKSKGTLLSVFLF